MKRESENGAGAVASNIGSINIEMPLYLNYSAWLCNKEARSNGRINVMSSILKIARTNATIEKDKSGIKYT